MRVSVCVVKDNTRASLPSIHTEIRLRKSVGNE